MHGSCGCGGAAIPPPPSLVWAKHLHRAGKRVGRSEGTSELQKAVRPSLFVPKDTRRGVWISFHSSSLTPEKCNRSETALRQKGWAHARLTHDSVQSQHFELGTFPFFASQLVTIFLKSTKPAGHKSNEVFHKAGRCSPYDCPREKPSEIAFFLKTFLGQVAAYLCGNEEAQYWIRKGCMASTDE